MSDSFHLNTHPYGLINQARGNNVPAHMAVAELVDNAIDARATVIDIKLSHDLLTIEDNGNGFTYSDLLNAFQTISNPPATTDDKIKIGRYNTGMKMAVIRLGDSLTILTKAKNQKGGYSFFVDWKKVCYHNDVIKNPTGFDVSFSHGTVLTINTLWEHDEKRDPRNIIYHLSKIYRRQINDGLIIKINNVPVPALSKIPLISNGHIITGDDYTIRYGLYEHDKIVDSDWLIRDVNGVHIYYRNRLLAAPEQIRTSYGIDHDGYYVEINTNSSDYGPNVYKDGLAYVGKILTPKIVSTINDDLEKDQGEAKKQKNKKFFDELTQMFKDVAKKSKKDKNGDESEIGRGMRGPKINILPLNDDTHKHGTVHEEYEKINVDVTEKKHKSKSKECDLSKIRVEESRTPQIGRYGYAAVDKLTGCATIHLDVETSAYTSMLFKKNHKASLFYLAISILAEVWVADMDVTDTVEQFIYKHTKNLQN